MAVVALDGFSLCFSFPDANHVSDHETHKEKSAILVVLSESACEAL